MAHLDLEPRHHLDLEPHLDLDPESLQPCPQDADAAWITPSNPGSPTLESAAVNTNQVWLVPISPRSPPSASSVHETDSASVVPSNPNVTIPASFALETDEAWIAPCTPSGIAPASSAHDAVPVSPVPTSIASGTDAATVASWNPSGNTPASAAQETVAESNATSNSSHSAPVSSAPVSSATFRVYYVWLTVALAIMLAQSTPFAFAPLDPKCDITNGNLSSTMLLRLPASLIPQWCSGAFVAFVFSNPRSYLKGSRLRMWTISYALAAFTCSWSSLLDLVLYCSSETPTFLERFTFLPFFGISLGQVWLVSLSLLTLHRFAFVAPAMAQLGQTVSRFSLIMITLGFLAVPFLWPEWCQPVIAIVWSFVELVSMLTMLAFCSIVVLVLESSAKTAAKEASESDVDEITSSQCKLAARRTRFAAIATATGGAASVVLSVSTGILGTSDSVVWAVWWKWAFAADLAANVVASAVHLSILSGIKGDEQVVAMSVQAHKRRQLEHGLAIHGASMASSLTIASIFEGASPDELVRDAAERFRCIRWEVLMKRPDIVIGGLRQNGGGSHANDLYALSEPCLLGECDAFLSHSHYDNGLQVWEALQSWCYEFTRSHGRSPRLWLDRVCTNQQNISADLRCLPVFMAGCTNFVATIGPTFPIRLWCCLELLVLKAMLANDSNRSSPVLSLLGDDEEQRESGREAFRDFRVDDCECCNLEDKRRFLKVVAQYPGATEGFNRFVRRLAADLREDTYDFDESF
eukprot:TRINITY_DN20964_c1_g1_i1.p1 TRINITY_DN20964_c1_g1~~TRINITY_DN20964_c1_g1_i1.p1  ORF type:complete len:770 (-),score=77.75 TRINITY_DN20964_c1_g1_i1:445-2700(-)